MANRQPHCFGSESYLPEIANEKSKCLSTRLCLRYGHPFFVEQVAYTIGCFRRLDWECNFIRSLPLSINLLELELNYVDNDVRIAMHTETGPLDTLDLLSDILRRHEDIDSLTFFEYPKQVLLQDSIELDAAGRVQLNEALERRDATKLPFWDSLMLTFFYRDKFSHSILQAAIRHNKINKRSFTRDVGLIRNMVNSGKNISVNSQIRLQGEERHLLLLDFHIPPSSANLLVVKQVLKTLGTAGCVLDSGKSYHFVGRDVYSKDELITMLAKALLFAPIIDRAWVGHQIIERSCSIRVGYKHGRIPVVVEFV